MKLPFKFTRQGLLLSGKDREKARIEYELSGQEKDRALLLLEYDTPELQKLPQCKIRKLDIDKKYGCIDDYQYEIEMNNLNIDNKSKTEVLANEYDIMLKYGKISKLEYCKQKNDVLGKPWVAIKTNDDKDINLDNIEIEVAYNKTFIKNMRAKGISGDTDDDVAGEWLKLFFISNLEDDDIQALTEEAEENIEYVKKAKLNNNSTLIC